MYMLYDLFSALNRKEGSITFSGKRVEQVAEAKMSPNAYVSLGFVGHRLRLVKILTSRSNNALLTPSYC